jgi:dipeptidase D
MLAVPQGVQAMNVDFPGLVQTSLNLGIVETKPDGVYFSVSIRSCIASQKAMMVQRLEAILALGGGAVSQRSSYPGWQYARQSVLREDVLAAWKAVSGREGRIEATHGGLECGLFIEKIPGLDAVSFGPELHDVHSTAEKLSVASTKLVYELTRELLRRSK